MGLVEMMWGYDSGGIWLGMGSMMLLFWGGVILLATWTIRAVNSSQPMGDAAIDALRSAGEVGGRPRKDREGAGVGL